MARRGLAYLSSDVARSSTLPSKRSPHAQIIPAGPRRFSAVDRAYRGRRLAQELNMERIVTGNDVGNAAIVAVNRKLGYRQQPGICKLLRE